MTVPTVGETHDVVLYDLTGVLPPVGLVVAPFSYRVGKAPTFIPRMSVGDLSGADFEAWTSWVQNDFRSGIGAHAQGQETRYAYSRGFVADRKQGHLRTGPFIDYLSDYVQYTPGLNSDLIEAIRAKVSRAESVEIGGWHYVLYHDAVYRLGATGFTIDAEVSTSGYVFVRAVSFSGVVVAAVAHTSGMHARWDGGHLSFTEDGAVCADGLVVFDPSTKTLYAAGPDLWCAPAALAIYDNRLWYAERETGKIHYYNTGDAAWSDGIEVCDEPILSMAPFIGRLMLGTSGGVYAYEAGRAYQVLDLAWGQYPTNCELFFSSPSALYFNVKNRLFRYTTGGLLEELDVDFGWPYAASVHPRGLILSVNLSGGQPNRYSFGLCLFDEETGGVFPIVDGDSTLYTGGDV